MTEARKWNLDELEAIDAACKSLSEAIEMRRLAVDKFWPSHSEQNADQRVSNRIAKLSAAIAKARGE